MIPFSLFASCRRSTSQLTNCSPLTSLTLKKPLLVCHKGPTLGLKEPLGRGIGSTCILVPRVVYGAMVSTERMLVCALGLCPKLFILVLESLWHKFGTGVPWELLYADDLVLNADTQEECISNVKAWKAGMWNKGFISTWKRPIFWSLVMARIFPRNLASTLVLSL